MGTRVTSRVITISPRSVEPEIVDNPNQIEAEFNAGVISESEARQRLEEIIRDVPTSESKLKKLMAKLFGG